MKSPAQNEEHRAWPGAIPITSAYTAGVAGQIFFDALKQSGKLIATRCRPCKQVYLPARLFCERCFGALTEQVEIKSTGRLTSYTLCHVDRDRRPLRRPQALALVQLDGASTVMLHYLLDVSRPEQVAMGARVEVIIKPKGRRIGSILDIEGFRLVDAAEFSSKRKRRSKRG
ncbi:MAG TPA: Zn-ribbon domain-containing OB-fold protein [Candidatus Binatia bacterium]